MWIINQKSLIHVKLITKSHVTFAEPKKREEPKEKKSQNKKKQIEKQVVKSI